MTQNDLFLSSFTVRETLQFIAKLRLPETFSESEKMEIVSDVISAMNLDGCADTRVGGMFPAHRGISGGEKRRLSIAAEILTNPSLLFLDEPTSGLDSRTSYLVISLLKELAKTGKSIVTAIHQPSSKTFELFDKLLLLADGHVIFFGEAANAIEYLERHAYPCPRFYNPADYFLDMLVEACDDQGRPIKFHLIEIYKKFHPTNDTIQKKRSSNGFLSAKKSDLIDENAANAIFLKQSSDDTLLDNRSSTHLEDISLTDSDQSIPKYPCGWYTQMCLLTIRSSKIKKERRFSFLPMFQSMTMIFICSLIWFQMSYSEDSIIDRAGLLYFSILYIYVEPMFSVILGFSADRPIHEKERIAGTYHLSAYYVSRILTESPYNFLFASLYWIPVYWMAGMNTDVGRFFISWAIILMTSSIGLATGLLFSCYFLDLASASTYSMTYYAFELLVSGFYSRNIPVWFSWIHYLSAPYYLFHLAVINEFDDPSVFFTNGTKHIFESYPVPGKIAMEQIGVSPNELWIDLLGSFSFLAGFFALGYFSLRFLNRPST